MPAVGNEIGVQQQDEVRPAPGSQHMKQGIVDVAGLGMLALHPEQIARTELLCEVADPVAGTVIQHPDTQVGMVDIHRADDRPLQHGARLIIGGDEDIGRRVHQRRELRGVGLGRAVAGA